VRVIEALGYKYDGKWKAPADFKGTTLLSVEGDALHALLVMRADFAMCRPFCPNARSAAWPAKATSTHRV
jgi:hypothetical protein